LIDGNPSFLSPSIDAIFLATFFLLSFIRFPRPAFCNFFLCFCFRPLELLLRLSFSFLLPPLPVSTALTMASASTASASASTSVSASASSSASRFESVSVFFLLQELFLFFSPPYMVLGHPSYRCGHALK
jgi:hypothetical protein